MLDIKDTIVFADTIENLVTNDNYSYIEAIMAFVTSNQMELEAVPKLLTPTLKQKIEQEANSLNMLGKKTQKLPFNL